ncbi:ubiquitin-like-specific protease 1C isoform X2 [Salvia miltiorrhiza]|nr:ubiquitin-like-specific protease 1C isoform X2 [Salvia miltiorrhiza]XP_057773823.1 ubiquitin-like-specific protease 1C isoform X2 [Salvia miltiorrhiza]
MPSKEDDFGPMMLHLDSLHSDFHRCHVSESIFNNVRSFLVEEWELLKKEGLPELPLAENIWNELSQRIGQKVLKVPQQTNGYDCGLFVLFFIERFINDVPERLKTQHLDMLQKEWFKPEEASELRSRIRDLLKQEFKEANVIPTTAV